MERNITLRVDEGLLEDAGRGLVRMDSQDMQKLGLSPGGVVEVVGRRRTAAKVLPSFGDLYGRGMLQMDAAGRENAQAELAEEVEVEPSSARPAAEVLLSPVLAGNSGEATPERLEYLRERLAGRVLVRGDLLTVPLVGQDAERYQVEGCNPRGVVLLVRDTVLRLQPAQAPQEAPGVGYEDIGGLGRELERVREIVELPLQFPDLFRRLGVAAPKGLLLYGPPGTGKTLIARAVARGSGAHFIHVSGPEIMHKYYGESEARLREIFAEAQRYTPSIIFLDELDAIAPRRMEVHGDVEKRVVAQLLALLDGLEPRGEVIILAATNLPELVDPALRRPGRFDRELAIGVPDRLGRLEILRIHTRAMNMGAGVSLEDLARVTHGFVGADLAALCREAGMRALRRLLPQLKRRQGDVQMEVTGQDFADALAEVEPSATREFYVEIPDLTWDDVGGLEDIRERLESLVVWPLKHSEIFQVLQLEAPRGILLTGPAGSGKTMVAKALARESGLNLIPVSGAILASRWAGEAEKTLHGVFRKARQAAPCLLFLDEVDAIAPVRGGAGHAAERLISQLLVEMDGMEELRGVLVLAATNRPDLVDPALLRPGRFDEVIEFPVPDARRRCAIFAACLRRKPVHSSVDLEQLARETEGCMGSHIAAICRRAAMLAAREAIGGQTQAEAQEPEAPSLRPEHLHLAAGEFRRNVAPGVAPGVPGLTSLANSLGEGV